MSKRPILCCLSLIMLLAFMLTGCSGSEGNMEDKTPPERPVMIPHLGDTGDDESMIDSLFTQYYGYVDLDDDHNGIDAFPGENYIQLAWMPLDTQVKSIQVYRYSPDGTGSQTPSLVGTLSNDSTPESWLDNTLGSGTVDPTDKTWYYFIKVFDESGNAAVSDTVSYTLKPQPLPISPYSNEVIASSDDLAFNWDTTSGCNLYRVLLFDADTNECVWHNDWNMEGGLEPMVQYSDTGSPALVVNHNLYWRVDALGSAGEALGSESAEIPFRVGNPAKVKKP